VFFLIGIDDTDSPTSEGTTHHARRLGEVIEERKHGRLVSITRHQLFQHPDIYYTTTNSSACMLVDAPKEARRDLELDCREFLRRFSAPSSDPGFALAAWRDVSPEVVTWGRQAKHTRHFRSEAIELAKLNNISCAGFHGSGSGVIGALAAIGLYFSGNDGCFTWLPGLDRLNGTLTLPVLLSMCTIERVENFRGRRPLERDLIHLGDAPIPVLRDGKPVLLLEAAARGEPYQWRVYTREEIEKISS
jgi:hypothetical protein